jgi:hypothetical protein
VYRHKTDAQLDHDIRMTEKQIRQLQADRKALKDERTRRIESEVLWKGKPTHGGNIITEGANPN